MAQGLQGVDCAMMLDRPRLKPDKGKYDLHDNARAERADKGADPDRAAKQPADEQRRSPKA